MKDLKIDKPIRLIELFAGIGAQAKALQRLGANFEHYRICEFDKYAIKSYNAIHGTNFEPTDITKIHGSDLGIVEKDKYCYICCYSFPCQDLSLAGKGKGMQNGSLPHRGRQGQAQGNALKGGSIQLTVSFSEKSARSSEYYVAERFCERLFCALITKIKIKKR